MEKHTSSPLSCHFILWHMSTSYAWLIQKKSEDLEPAFVGSRCIGMSGFVRINLNFVNSLVSLSRPAYNKMTIVMVNVIRRHVLELIGCCTATFCV